MLSLKPKRVLSVLLLNGLIILSSAAIATAAGQSSSPHYQVNEAFFGTGGQLCDPGVSGYSSNYCAQSSAGELTVGNTASNNYQAQGGFNTGRVPSLTLIVNDSQCAYYNPAQNLGEPTTTATTTANGNFSVSSYLSDGYVVQAHGSTPTNNGHSLPSMSGSAPTPGTEQFGMNLVDNTTPNIGANPEQIPDNTFSFGQASTGYDTPDSFKYNDGDKVAESPKSSSTTCYVLSYVINVSTVTPGGTYNFDQTFVATSTF